MKLCDNETAKEICGILDKHGKHCYIAGGAVRDSIMNKPIHDLDFTTDAIPEEVTNIFQSENCKVIPTGISHGTVTVHCKGHDPVEITTFRSESTYSDGRHPDSVTFVNDIESDLARRDFTVNSIALSPLDCKIVDPFNGQGDIKNKVIRATGNAQDRFNEDGLRPFRAARFATKLDFTIDPDTLSAMTTSNTHNVVQKVAQERITDEFKKALSTSNPEVFIKTLADTGLLWLVLPEMKPMIGMQQPSKHHDYDVWNHSVEAMKSVVPCVGEDELSKFFDGKLRNAWLNIDNDMVVYVRKGKHLIDGKIRDTIDVGNVEVSPDKQGQGIYTSFIRTVEQFAAKNNLYIYFENTHNDQLKESHERHGYHPSYPPGDNSGVPSYYKSPDEIDRGKVCVGIKDLPFSRWVALTHDIGKPSTYTNENGEIHFIGHDKVGSEMIEVIMKRMKGWNSKEIDKGKQLICNHLIFYNLDWTDPQLRRWINKVSPDNVRFQINLARSDLTGHGTKKLDELKHYDDLERRIKLSPEKKGLAVKDLKVDGQDVMRELNLEPSREVGEVLNFLLEVIIEDPGKNDREILLGIIRSFK